MLSIKKYDLTRFVNFGIILTMRHTLLELVKLINIRLTRSYRFVTQTLRSYRTSKEQSVHSGLLPGVEYVAIGKYTGRIVLLKLDPDRLVVTYYDGVVYICHPEVIGNYNIVGEL